MSTSDQRLTADHGEVVKIIRLYKNINLINTSGEPVDEYDIEYKVRGYTISPGGDVTIGDRHRIKIKIPFGYPHFPPTIKPLSPIFHPEIDENVVPIANYWEENKSLPELVLHIGKMICGEKYSDESPFNNKAADFYKNHQDSLPLDSLKLVAEETKKVAKKKVERNYFKPLLSVLSAIILVALLVTGGRAFFEKWEISRASEILNTAQNLLNDKEFKKAQEKGLSAQKSLPSFYLLRSSGNSLQQKIDSFLQSQELTEGLQGKIKYGDTFISLDRVHRLEFVKDLIAEAETHLNRGNQEEAIATYTEALEYATEHKLEKDREQIHHDLASIQLQVLVSESEKGHKSKNWSWAIKQHDNVLDFIDKNEKYLDNAKKQEAKTRHLLMIDKIAFYTQETSAAETRYDLASALKYQTSLIKLIEKTPSPTKTLKKTLQDARLKAAVLREKINIEKKRQWLLDNYREIFQANYPAILPSSLRSPQAIFVKYDDKSMVFDLSCLEKGTGSVVRLRIFYEYDPDTEQWSVYNGVIENNS